MIHYRINLLAHRPAESNASRQQFKREILLLGLLTIIAIAIPAMDIERRHRDVDQTNAALRQHIKRTEAAINTAAIQDNLRQHATALNSSESVPPNQRQDLLPFLVTLAQQIPEPVALSNLQQNDNHILLTGVSDSPQALLSFLEHLEAIPGVSQLTINTIDANPQTQRQGFVVNCLLANAHLTPASRP